MEPSRHPRVGNPPDRDDFLSHAALGYRFADPKRARQAEGISVFATRTQARCQAKQNPILGGWFSELSVDPTRGVRVERTEGRPGHHTVWGDPDLLLGSVLRAVPVDE